MMLRKVITTLVLGALAFSAPAGPALAVQDVPHSLKELSDEVKTYHGKRDCEAMPNLFYTYNMDEVRKAAFVSTIKQSLCANFYQKIASIRYASIPAERNKPPADFGGTHSQYTLPPLGIMIIEYIGGAGGIKSLSFRYGKHEDGFYLITTRQADAP